MAKLVMQGEVIEVEEGMSIQDILEENGFNIRSVTARKTTGELTMAYVVQANDIILVAENGENGLLGLWG